MSDRGPVATHRPSSISFGLNDEVVSGAQRVVRWFPMRTKSRRVISSKTEIEKHRRESKADQCRMLRLGSTVVDFEHE